MDNTSRRHSNEDTTTSMYLSFDAESTMSTACYKTLEGIDDISVLSAVDLNEAVDIRKSDDQMNSTLELHENKSPLKTVKKIELQGSGKSNTPLKVLPKNILKEYKALCSTPAREQLLKTVDVTRGSDASRCVDLGLAFLGVDDEKPAYFPLTSLALQDENKENLLPDADEASTLSTSSSVEVTSVIEKKVLTSISIVDSVNEEKSGEGAKFIKNMQQEVAVGTVDEILDDNKDYYKIEGKPKNFMTFNKENYENITRVNKPDDIKYVGTIKESLDMQKEINTSVNDGDKDYAESTEVLETISETEVENMKDVDKIKGSLELHEDNLFKLKEMKFEEKDVSKNTSKTKIGVLKGNLRRSMCEPNLQTNRPSRILNSDNKRRSCLPTSKKFTSSMDAESEIPLLMSRMLKITNTPMEDDNQKETDVLKNDNHVDKRRPVIPLQKKRTSLLPSAPGNKRIFSFNQRMSVAVKTTLNSPARKIARISSTSGVIPLSRKNTVTQKTSSNDKSKVKNPDIVARKSMVPKLGSSIPQSSKKVLDSLQESEKPTSSTVQRKSLYVLPNIKETNINAKISDNKPFISYTCNICQEKFRIKSLLDAHKRSHESDNRPPTFIRKPLTITHPVSGTVLGNTNQCKYCDKKFALLKALHIHLLQNCSKIPPSEKRKLEYTDLNHVEKAQLPVFSHNSLQSSVTSLVSSSSDTSQYAWKQCATTKISSESLNENRDIKKISTVNENNAMAHQTTTQKSKKINAHAGVYRTPSKSVPCHLCKLTFKSILDYTNHNLTTHGSYKAGTTDTVKAIKKNND